MTKSQKRQKSKTSKSSASIPSIASIPRSISPRNITPSPAISIASNSSIREDLKQIWENPNNQPLDTRRETMSDEVKNFLPYKVQDLYRKFRKNKGGKKSLTIKNKKARKTLKKPMFKRKSAKHK